MKSKKRSSFIWKYFKLSDDKKATCNICRKVLTYSLSSMSNLNRHIKNKHPQIIRSNKGEEMPVEIFSVEEVNTSGGSQLKTYEITMKSFEEIDQDNNPSEKDPNWTPEAAEDWTKPLPCQKSTNKPPRRSAVWDHFEKFADRTAGQCQHCGTVIKLGTVSNLARHLRQKHPNTPILIHKPENPSKLETDLSKEHEQDILRNEVDICTEVIEVNIDDIENPINIIETRTDESTNVPQFVFDYEEINTVNVTQASQTEFLGDEDFDMCEYIKPKQTGLVAEQIDRQLVKMIVKGCHHVNIVEQPSFKEFVCLLNPKYKLPSTSKITQILIPEYYGECEKKASKSLLAAEGICLYVDHWKSKTNRYMCVTAHFINTECKFESLFLSCHVLSQDESPGDISERLRDTVNEWEISEKITAVVTENSDVTSLAIALCNWPHIPHFVRSLSLIVHESLQTVKTIVFKVKSTIGELIKTPGVLADVYSRQKILGLPPVKLITKVKSDSNSSFATVEMLTRFAKLRIAICQVQEKVTGVKLSDNDWKVIQGVVEILGVFKVVKKEVFDEERVCLSKIDFYIRTLKKEMKAFLNLNTMPSDATYVATIAEAGLNKQFGDIEGIELVTNVLLLDPRMKKYAFDNDIEYVTACSKLKREVCEVNLPEPQYHEPNNQSIWQDFDKEVAKLNAVKDPIGKGILELENYLQEQLLGRDEDPLVWWNQRKAIYPRLFSLAKKYLCVTAKSAVRESISFKSANMLDNLNIYNDSPSESEVMFLHHNM